MARDRRACASHFPPTVYFENLNSIRFIAAFLVIVSHIEQFKGIFHLPNRFDQPAVSNMGHLAVVMFFVLSGFLISYLLFEEQQLTGTIGLANFYMRRILRIWPLYLLTILLALLYPFIPLLTLEGYPQESIWSHLPWKILLFVLFLPNLLLQVFGVIPFASQTWSIGAEEQFYLIWPVLNRAFRNKARLIGSVIGVYLLVRGTLALASQSSIARTAADFLDLCPLDCMAIGGGFALMVHRRADTWLQTLVFARTTQWLVLLATVALMFRGRWFPLFYEVHAVLFGALISSFAANSKRLFSMETPVLNYQGKISYGIYMYHPVAIVLSIRLLQALHALSDYTLYPLATGLTIAISAISYEAFEKWFIRRKIGFSALVTGDNVRNTFAASLTASGR